LYCTASLWFSDGSWCTIGPSWCLEEGEKRKGSEGKGKEEGGRDLKEDLYAVGGWEIMEEGWRSGSSGLGRNLRKDDGLEDAGIQVPWVTSDR